MPIVIQAYSFNPYYTLILILLTPLDERVNCRPERSKNLPKVTELVSGWPGPSDYKAHEVSIRPALLHTSSLATHAVSFLRHCFTLDSDPLRRGVAWLAWRARGLDTNQQLLRGAGLRAWSPLHSPLPSLASLKYHSITYTISWTLHPRIN